jgi:uncharacterized membrane protein YgcG
MYYPASQVTTNLNTNGGEFVYANTLQDYKGYYYKTSKGEYFTGKTPQDGLNELLISSPLEDGVQTTIQNNIESFINTDDTQVGDYLNITNQSSIASSSPTYSATLPTQQNYQNTEFRRYFCKKSNEIIYLEISKETYDKLVAKDSQILFQLYIPFNLPWKLTGDREQVYKINKNITELTSVRQNLPMLSEYLKMNFTKYYKYPEASNLYTKGNELKTTQDNKMYVGPYHIHPDKGYMVGATHVLEPHAYLSPINGFFYMGPSFKDTSKSSPIINILPPSGNGGYLGGGGNSVGGGNSGGGNSGGGGY